MIQIIKQEKITEPKLLLRLLWEDLTPQKVEGRINQQRDSLPPTNIVLQTQMLDISLLHTSYIPCGYDPQHQAPRHPLNRPMLR